MAIRSVYRLWICYGEQNDTYTSLQKGNPSLYPKIYTEQIFGDFSTPIEAGLSISGYLKQWDRENPRKQIPTFKIVEHIINEKNEDLFYNNSISSGDEDLELGTLEEYLRVNNITLPRDP
tara:strand:- start:132 stop:491 length:360 start_codon:yes stop_codon:yes gene_type:complete